MTVTLDGKYPSEIAIEEIETCCRETIERMSKIFCQYCVREKDWLGNPLANILSYNEASRHLLESFDLFKKALNDKERTGY
jgi:hypothetical protein